MRHTILFSLIALLALTSCDDRSDIWSNVDYLSSFQINQTDKATLIPTDDFYSDSVKLGLSYTYAYSFNNSDQSELNFTLDPTLGTIEKNVIDQTFTYTSRKIAVCPVEIKIIDPFLKEKTLTLELTTKGNKLPIASFVVNTIGSVSDYQIEIDASNSYDGDHYLGGYITEYEYEIEGLSKDVITYSSYKRVLADTGNYTINLRVKDNDNEWSPVVSLVHTIE